MEKSIIKISSSFMLRRIDPIEILSNYLKGNYKSLDLPKDKIETKKGILIIGKNTGKDKSYEIYRFTDKSNSKQTIITTNHISYKHAIDQLNNKTNLTNPIIKCLYCRRFIKENPVGIPVSMESDLKNNIVKFNVDGNYCNFNCVYADLKRMVSVSRIYQDPLYMDSEQMLHVMYHKMYPEKCKERIIEAPDWRLLKENGGPLSDKEFDENSNNYIPLTSIVQVPIKRQFIKLSSKK